MRTAQKAQAKHGFEPACGGPAAGLSRIGFHSTASRGSGQFHGRGSPPNHRGGGHAIRDDKGHTCNPQSRRNQAQSPQDGAQEQRQAKAKPSIKPQQHQHAAMPASAAGLPALPLPAQAEALVVDPAQPPSAEPALVPAQSPITVSAPQPAAHARQTATAPVQSRALAAHRPDGLLDHIAAWLASRGRAIRLALIGQPRRAPQPKATLQPMAVHKPRRDPRQDELARLRQENRKLQLQLQALLALQGEPARPKEPVQ